MHDATNTTESHLRREVAELLLEGPRQGVGSLVKQCRVQRGIRNERDLETIIRALCAHQPTWVAEFKKRTRKRSKCPTKLRRVIERCMELRHLGETTDGRVTADDVLRQMRNPRSAGTLRITDKDELGFGDPYLFFLAKLHTLATRQATPVDLSVEFDCELVYVHGLALLAAWCDRNAARVRLSARSPMVERYLDDTGFRRVIEDRVTIHAPLYDGENHVALTRVDREDQRAAEEVANRLVHLFDRHLGLDRAKNMALTTMFAELVENVYRHAQSNYPSYVMAQAYPQTRKLHIVVADTGIGVYASFRESDSPDVRSQARTEKDAVSMALEKLITSKTAKHSGYGLFLVRRLVELNRGWMRLTSGRVTKRFGLRQARWRRSPPKDDMKQHLPWSGTEVSVVFNLDRDLPLAKVYRELGPLGHDEDFFD